MIQIYESPHENMRNFRFRNIYDYTLRETQNCFAYNGGGDLPCGQYVDPGANDMVLVLLEFIFVLLIVAAVPDVTVDGPGANKIGGGGAG